MEKVDLDLNGFLCPMPDTKYFSIGNYLGKAWDVEKADIQGEMK
jgi:hypothetical protein